jgi:hypothetical protein
VQQEVGVTQDMSDNYGIQISGGSLNVGNLAIGPRAHAHKAVYRSIQSEQEDSQEIIEKPMEPEKTFDVFLCYHSKDKSSVRKIGKQLKKRGILPWFDDWELRPGLAWQSLLEQQIGEIKAAAVFVGEGGIGPWQQQELYAFLREFVDRGCPVIPVLLENVHQEPQLPLFLKGMTWVDFRKQDSAPLERLIWGITGYRRTEE